MGPSTAVRTLTYAVWDFVRFEVCFSQDHQHNMHIMLTTGCPCVLYGENQGLIAEIQTGTWKDATRECNEWFLLACCFGVLSNICTASMSMDQRAQLRRIYNLEGDNQQAYCFALWLAECALCQTRLEIKRRSETTSEGRKGEKISTKAPVVQEMLSGGSAPSSQIRISLDTPL